VAAGTHARCCVQFSVTRQHESYNVSASEAADPLVHAPQVARFDTSTLLAMFDQGIALQKVLDVKSATPSARRRPSDGLPEETGGIGRTGRTHEYSEVVKIRS